MFLQQQQQANYNDANDSQDLHLRPLTNARGHLDDVESHCSSSVTTDLFALNTSRHFFDSRDSYPASSDVDDDFDKTLDEGKRATSWWDTLLLMAVRRRHSPDRAGIDKHRGDNPLLGAGFAFPRARRRSYYNWCIFGGLSGAGLLAVLLSVNLTLSLVTLYWYSDIDRALRDWGTAGSGTEGLAWYPTDFTRDVVPIPCHSHNDYWRKVPLFSALRVGCTGIEADVWLFDNELYVGHNTASLTRNRTFQSLYIEPLVKILEDQNPSTEFYNGSYHGVFDGDPDKSVVLLVDLKTSGLETLPWVLRQLEPLRERGWLTYVEDGVVHNRPVTVVGTGNTPFDLLTANSTYRDAFFDAPLETMWEARDTSTKVKSSLIMLDSPPDDGLEPEQNSSDEAHVVAEPLHNVGQGLSGTTPQSEFNEQNSYYASVSFGKAVGRVWRGRLSPKQMKIIRGQVRGAHRRGLKVRYWDLPSWPIGLRNHVWDVIMREGVDILNVDDIRAASRQVW